MLEVKLFGLGEVSYSGRKIIGFCHQLPGQVLCYLLLNRERPQNREHLAAVFWGDLAVPDSKKALRNNLWRLRHSLQMAGVPVTDYISPGDESVAFIHSSPYTLDVESFENLVIPCRAVQGFELSPTQAANLELAISLYRGDLLESIYEDWCLYDRERLRMLFMETLHKLMVYCGYNRAYECAIEYGKRLLRLDNTLEKIHRQLMLLYWMSEDRRSALAQYHYCSRILREELKCDPMLETQHIYRQMLRDQIDPEEWGEILKSSTLIGTSLSRSEDPALRRIQGELHRLQQIMQDAQATSHNIEQLIADAISK